MHIHDKNKGILILVKGPTDDLYDTTLPAEKEYFRNCTEQQKNICVSL